MLIWCSVSLKARTERCYIWTTILKLYFFTCCTFAHTRIAGTARDYLEETNITTMVGSAKNPELNPIEHVWNI